MTNHQSSLMLISMGYYGRSEGFDSNETMNKRKIASSLLVLGVNY